MSRPPRRGVVRRLRPQPVVNRSFILNPVFVHSFVWLSALGLLLLRYATFITPVHPRFMALVGLNALVSVTAYLTIRMIRALRRPSGRQRGRARFPKTRTGAISAGQIEAMKRFADILFVIWATGSVLNVFVSGGLPIVWVLRGVGKTYSDFGIPTFSGLIAACGLFASGGFFLYHLSRGSKLRIIGIAVVMVYQLAIINRGLVVYMFLEILCIYLLVGRLNAKRVIGGIAIILVLVSVFGALGDFRGGRGGAGLLRWTGTPEAIDRFEHLPSGLWWTYLYASVGSVNLNAALSQDLEATGYPYWSVINIFPTVIRSMVYTETSYEARYPLEMVSLAFNVFTLYGGYLADFGIPGCLLITFVLQLVACRYLLEARTGNVGSIIGYSVCFMVIIASLFTDAFTSWVTLFQFVLTGLFGIFSRSSQSALARRAVNAGQNTSATDPRVDGAPAGVHVS